MQRKQHPSFYRAIHKGFGKQILSEHAIAYSPPEHEDHSTGFCEVIHKWARKDLPYRIANEFIAGSLGKLIGLPIPPFVITNLPDDSGNLIKVFSSLDFNHDRKSLPLVMPDLCFESLPELCAGILVFDIWIANEDRHDENLVVDQTRKPNYVHVFDHDAALFGTSPNRDLTRVNLIQTRYLGCTPSEDHIVQGHRQLFLNLVDRESLLFPWIQKIELIPTFQIEDICAMATVELQLKEEEYIGIVEFLVSRRNRLRAIIKNNGKEFRSINFAENKELFS